MTKSSVHIDSQTFRSIAFDVMQESNICLPSGGYSMFPILMPGDELILSKRSIHDIRKGDIVVVAYPSKTVGHRVVAVNDSGIVTRGDNCRSVDPMVSPEHIIGVVVACVRNNVNYSVDSFRFACMRFLLLYVALFTRLGIRVMYSLYRLISAGILFYTSFRKQLHLIVQYSRPLLLKYIVVSSVQACMPFVLLVCVKLLIDTILHVQHAGVNTTLYVVLAIVAVTLLGTRILTSVATYIREKLGHSISLHIHSVLHAKHARLDFSHLEQSDTQDAIHRANAEAEHRPQRLVQQLVMLVKACVAAVIVLVFMSTVHWAVVPLLLIGLLPSIVVRIRQSKQLYTLQKQQRTAERKVTYLNRILTGIPFAKELRLFDTSNYFSQHYVHDSESIHNKKITLHKQIMWGEICAYAFAIIVVFGVLVYTIQLGLQGVVSLGTVVLFFLVLQRGFSVFNELFQSLAVVYQDSIFFQDFITFLGLSETSSQHQTIEKKYTVAPTIEFVNVSFSYPSSARKSIENVSIQIPAGKTIALVGENGSGKTTLIKLLCGLYVPQSGTITIDGVDSTKIDIQQLRKKISVVFQDFALYNMTVAENIHLGSINESIDMHALEQALKHSALASDVSDLPQGVDTLLGNLFAQGEELSIGQWQKIAIARALYRNAPIVILDEPSSALDALSEQTIVESLQTLLHKKTGIIISHTFSTIQWVDYIYVMKHGQIIECGTHDELLVNEGEYWRMYTLQKS